MPALRFSLKPTHSLSGQAIIAALIIIVVIATITATAIRRTSGTARSGARATDYARVERISDGVIEYAYGVWKAKTTTVGRALTKAEAGALVSAAPASSGFSYASGGDLAIKPVDAYGAEADAPARILTYLADYPGWKGFTYNYRATVRMQATTGLSANSVFAGTRRYFQYTEVPLFQSMYFFEHDLEIYRPAPMIVGGLVHGNTKLLVSGSKDQAGVELTFQGYVSHVQGISKDVPIGGAAWSGQSASQAEANVEAPTYPNGESAQVSRVDRYEPLGSKPQSVLNTTDTNPNNDSLREIIELPNTSFSDPPEIAKRRMSTKAGIIMQISSSGSTNTVTVTAQNGTTLTSAQITSLKAALTSKTTIYDQREGKNIDVANIDVSKLTPVLNAASGFNGVLYVYDSTGQVTGDTEPKTIRLQKGGILPNAGLTIASVNPVYIQGDYNTGTTSSPTSVPANNTGNPNNTDSPVVSGYTRKPAAVLADAVMLLSNSWSDANASAAVTSRVASNTTYNTAIMAGFMPSGWDPDGSGSQSPYGYSGGANNFPRFLESWSSKSCTYYGSMVELFQSKVHTGDWDTGVIYRPPNRRWNYDPNFTDNPPPGSLDAVVMSRGSWARL